MAQEQGKTPSRGERGKEAEEDLQPKPHLAESNYFLVSIFQAYQGSPLPCKHPQRMQKWHLGSLFRNTRAHRLVLKVNQGSERFRHPLGKVQWSARQRGGHN